MQPSYVFRFPIIHWLAFFACSRNKQFLERGEWSFIFKLKISFKLVRDSSVVRRHYIFLLEPLDVRELYIRKTADLPLRLLIGTFPRFVAIGFYFLSETLILIASPIIFLFIHNHLTFRKWCYTPLQHDFALDPIIPPFDFHFRIYKRDLAILTEWWQ